MRLRTAFACLMPLAGLVLACTSPKSTYTFDSGPPSDVTRSDGGGGPADNGTSADSRVPEERRQTLAHSFDTVRVEAGEEKTWICQAWHLDNEVPLYVKEVRAANGGAVHHSNWFAVPRTAFRAPEGTWGCDEANFNELVAGVVGTVFFAQSTQATAETQRFPEGTTLMIPPHSVIIVEAHFLNATSSRVDTALEVEFDAVPSSESGTHLAPLALTYYDLRLPPRSQSSFTSDCNLADVSMRARGHGIDFNVYYMLPHYHYWATGMRVELIGGPRDGELLFESNAAVGEPAGVTFEQPINVAGITGLRFSCSYDNPGDDRINWGFSDGEMCVLLAYTDADLKFVGGAQESTRLADDGSGVARFTSPCQALGFDSGT